MTTGPLFAQISCSSNCRSWLELLREVTEEFLVNLKLGRHRHVSKSGFMICVKLIEFFEAELEQFGYSDEIEYPVEQLDDIESTSTLLSHICRLVRVKSDLAGAYADVIDFVSIRDFVCLSKMLGAVADVDPKLFDTCIDIDKLAKVLRQSIYLLKSANQPQSSYRASDDWIGKNDLQRETGIGFPKYVINLDKIHPDKKETRAEVDLMNELDKVDRKCCSTIVCANWFKHFIVEVLKETYPVDRFSILICIWQVAVECEHLTLQQMMSQLVDQIVHEESNSLNEEELMQLTQVGSFWLTHHKRYQTTTSQGATHLGSDDDEVLQVEDFGDILTHGSESSSLPEASFSPNDDQPQTVAAKLCTKLRYLIDCELMLGVPCQLCGYKTSEPLETLMSGFTCPCCTNSSADRCSISYQPLNLIGLNSIAHSNPELAGLVILSPSEWVRAAFQASKENSNSHQELEQATSERVDIFENFERLVVIRDEDKPGEDLNGSSDESEDRSSKLGTKINVQLTDYQTILASYMSENLSKPKSVADKHQQIQSESWRMLRYMNRHRLKTGTWLPICSTDLLLIEHNKASICMRIQGAINHGISGTIWRCSARSVLTNLPLGCGKFFYELELIQGCFATNIAGTSSQYSCPLCNCALSRITCFK